RCCPCVGGDCPCPSVATYQGAATLAIGTTGPVGGRASRGGSPLRVPYNRPPLWARGWLQPLPAGYSRPCLQAPPLRAVGPASDIDLPCGLALAAVARPLVGALATAWPRVAGPAWGLAVAGRPSSSLPSLRKCSKNA
ncbi:hypothetical protein BHE74_00048439, partial [Ensete ventricosum]